MKGSSGGPLGDDQGRVIGLIVNGWVGAIPTTTVKAVIPANVIDIMEDWQIGTAPNPDCGSKTCFSTKLLTISGFLMK